MSDDELKKFNDDLDNEVNKILAGRELFKLDVKELEDLVNIYSKAHEEFEKFKDKLSEDVKNKLEEDLNDRMTSIANQLDAKQQLSNLEQYKSGYEKLNKLYQQYFASAQKEITIYKGNSDYNYYISELENFIRYTNKLGWNNQEEFNKINEQIFNISKGKEFDYDFVTNLDEYDETKIKEAIDNYQKAIDKVKNAKKICENRINGKPKPVTQSQNTNTSENKPTSTGNATSSQAGQSSKEDESQEQKPEVVTLNSLKKSKKLPKSLTETDLIKLCAKLGINIKNVDEALNEEQVSRLLNDYDVRRELNNERVIELNNKKIEEYNKLIDKYDSLLKDDELEPSIVEKITKLKEEIERERNNFIQENKKIASIGATVLFTSKDGSRNALNEVSYAVNDTFAQADNDNLRDAYREKDRLEEERKKLKSTKYTRVWDRKIEKVEKRIKKLKEKGVKLDAKQVKIVNESSEEYIYRKTTLLNRMRNKQKEVVDKIEESQDLREQSNLLKKELRDVERVKKVSSSGIQKMVYSAQGFLLKQKIDSLSRKKGRVDRRIQYVDTSTIGLKI